MKESRFLLGEVNGKPTAPTPPPSIPPYQPGKKLRLGEHTTLPLKRLPSRVYRVHIAYPSHSVGYEIKAQSKAVSQSIIEIDYHKSDYYTNGISPQRLLDNLDIACASLLYPLTIYVDYQKQYRQVNTISEIKKRFDEGLPRLVKEYKGDLFTEYIHQIQQSLSQPYHFSQQLFTRDFFFALFTHRIYLSYSAAREVDTIIPLHLAGIRTLLLFKGKQRIEPVYNNVEGVFVHIEGKATDNEGKDYALTVEYNLDYADYTIKDIVADIYQLADETREKRVSITIHQLRKQEPDRKSREQQQTQQSAAWYETELENEKRYQQYLKNKRNWIDKLLDYF